MTDEAAIYDLADRFMRAIEQGDLAGVAACYAPGARIWHNNDGKEQSVEDNLKVLGWLGKRLDNRKYQIARRSVFPGGYVQQHVLEGTLADGSQFSMPACIVVQIEQGRIVRLDEYLDSAHIQPLLRG